jgi:hypothetical protein
VTEAQRNQNDALSDGVQALALVGPSDAFRTSAAKRCQEELGKDWSASLATGNLDEDMRRLVDHWTAYSQANPWVQAAAAKAFGGFDMTTGYWSRASYGVRYNDPAPGYVTAMQAIYQRTQDFYAKKKKAEFTILRGVRSAVGMRSPLESWTLDKKTASVFDGHAVLERTEKVDRVLMTWESMKGIFPPENELKGKKEVVLLGLDWMKP